MTQRASPPLPWKTRLYIALLSAVTDGARRSDGTINRCILSFFDARSSASAKPRRGVRTADVSVDPSRDLWFRLFVPSSASSGRIPVIVYFHGGGFAYLSPASRAYDAFCRRICREINALVVSVNYRLAPEHRCFLAGDSAGGNMVHHVARRWAADAAGRWKNLRLAGMVLIQPFFGGEERTESEMRLAGAPLVSVERTDWLWRVFLPEGAGRDHEAANVFGPRADGELEAALPQAMVVVGGFDPLQDWQRRYYEGMTARGKAVRLLEYPDAIHAFYVFPELNQSAAFIEELKAFIE
ncbi:gibberellin receptor [Musa troglodytarum]|uniref:Gibberellin receptor n=1 Tax=Musa troglodytarum TaxID=320322 RepID=A0A9E7HJA7_9LILI|nr:gibberellin receptor [Musa troglodytarum]